MQDATQPARKVLPEVVLIGVILAVSGIATVFALPANITSLAQHLHAGKWSIAHCWNVFVWLQVVARCLVGVALLCRLRWARRGAVLMLAIQMGVLAINSTKGLFTSVPLPFPVPMSLKLTDLLSDLITIGSYGAMVLILETTRVRAVWTDGTPRRRLTLWARRVFGWVQRAGYPLCYFVILLQLLLWLLPDIGSLLSYYYVFHLPISARYIQDYSRQVMWTYWMLSGEIIVLLATIVIFFVKTRWAHYSVLVGLSVRTLEIAAWFVFLIWTLIDGLCEHQTDHHYFLEARDGLGGTIELVIVYAAVLLIFLRNRPAFMNPLPTPPPPADPDGEVLAAQGGSV